MDSENQTTVRIQFTGPVWISRQLGDIYVIYMYIHTHYLRYMREDRNSLRDKYIIEPRVPSQSTEAKSTEFILNKSIKKKNPKLGSDKHKKRQYP